MPQNEETDENLLDGRDYCDVLSCLNEGSINGLLRNFIVDMEKFPMDYFMQSPGDGNFWDPRFFQILLNRFQANSQFMIPHQQASYLALLFQFQTLKEL